MNDATLVQIDLPDECDCKSYLEGKSSVVFPVAAYQCSVRGCEHRASMAIGVAARRSDNGPGSGIAMMPLCVCQHCVVTGMNVLTDLVLDAVEEQANE